MSDTDQIKKNTDYNCQYVSLEHRSKEQGTINARSFYYVSYIGICIFCIQVLVQLKLHYILRFAVYVVVISFQRPCLRRLFITLYPKYER